MSRTEELNARASAALEKYKSDFLAFVDNAAVAMPSNAEIPALKAAGLAVLEQACQSTLQAAGQAVRGDSVRQDGVISGVAPGCHDQAALGVI